MLTFNDATEILGLCKIPVDVQQNILMYFLSYGTPTSNLIKSQLECSDTSFNGSLVERIILEHDMTLWRLKVFLNGGITFNGSNIKNLRVSYELRIAYLKNGSCDWKNLDSISNLKEAIKTNSDYDLFTMFYNLDKFNYGEYGTPTANIIRNAISTEIINKFDPIIGYEVDQDV